MTSSFLFLTLIVLIAHGGSVQGDKTRCKRQLSSNICFLIPENEEGPYYWNYTTYRQNITEDRTGIPFTLQLTVIDVNTCLPIPMAVVDIWHCDGLGVYSHYETATTSTWLRGVLYTDAYGIVSFYSVYPGWYSGRATHIHIKVHVNGTYDNTTGLYTGGRVSHTGQMFLNDTITDQVAQISPYINHAITRTLNSVDRVYTGQNGTYSILSLSYTNSALGLAGGIIATLTLGIDPTSTPAAVSTGTGAMNNTMNGGGPGGPGNGTMSNQSSTSTSSSVTTNSSSTSRSSSLHSIDFIFSLSFRCVQVITIVLPFMMINLNK